MSREFVYGNDETRWNTSPPKLDFRTPSHTESQFQFVQICWECDPKGTQSLSKLRLAGAFGTKIWYERGSKYTSKNNPRNIPKRYQKVVGNEVQKNDSFVVFLGLEPKAFQGGLKDTFWDPRMSNVSQKTPKGHPEPYFFIVSLAITAISTSL